MYTVQTGISIMTFYKVFIDNSLYKNVFSIEVLVDN